MPQFIVTSEGNYRITQLFGQNPAIYGRFGMIGHNGVDFVGMARNYSFSDGEMHETGYDSDGYGYYCKVRDDAGRIWTYAHFAQPVEARGRIEVMQDLGPMGTTGFSTGVHCHVGVKPRNPDRSNGYYGSIDPLPLINHNLSEYMSKLDEILRGQQDMKNHLQVIEDNQKELKRMAKNAKGENRWQKQGRRLKSVEADVKVIKKAVK